VVSLVVTGVNTDTCDSMKHWEILPA
jgi:hypothetical protein